ncbi:hypothetical protein ACJX0J_011659, partial [Zea mays]
VHIHTFEFALMLLKILIIIAPEPCDKNLCDNIIFLTNISKNVSKRDVQLRKYRLLIIATHAHTCGFLLWYNILFKNR